MGDQSKEEERGECREMRDRDTWRDLISGPRSTLFFVFGKIHTSLN